MDALLTKTYHGSRITCNLGTGTHFSGNALITHVDYFQMPRHSGARIVLRLR
jgi:hypothetical protein